MGFESFAVQIQYRRGSEAGMPVPKSRGSRPKPGFRISVYVLWRIVMSTSTLLLVILLLIILGAVPVWPYSRS